MPRFVALLRGINVGGKNAVKMASLKACFEEHGFDEVATYIQSGNVVFTAKGSAVSVTSRVEKALASAYKSPFRSS